MAMAFASTFNRVAVPYVNDCWDGQIHGVPPPDPNNFNNVKNNFIAEYIIFNTPAVRFMYRLWYFYFVLHK